MTIFPTEGGKELSILKSIEPSFPSISEIVNTEDGMVRISVLELHFILPIEVTEEGIVMFLFAYHPKIELTEEGIVILSQISIFPMDVTVEGMIMPLQLYKFPIDVTDEGILIPLHVNSPPIIVTDIGMVILLQLPKLLIEVTVSGNDVSDNPEISPKAVIPFGKSIFIFEQPDILPKFVTVDGIVILSQLLKKPIEETEDGIVRPLQLFKPPIEATVLGNETSVNPEILPK